jgi:hypothetical protein
MDQEGSQTEHSPISSMSATPPPGRTTEPSPSDTELYKGSSTAQSDTLLPVNPSIFHDSEGTRSSPSPPNSTCFNWWRRTCPHAGAFRQNGAHYLFNGRARRSLDLRTTCGSWPQGGLCCWPARLCWRAHSVNHGEDHDLARSVGYAMNLIGFYTVDGAALCGYCDVGIVAGNADGE